MRTQWQILPQNTSFVEHHVYMGSQQECPNPITCPAAEHGKMSGVRQSQAAISCHQQFPGTSARRGSRWQLQHRQFPGEPSSYPPVLSGCFMLYSKERLSPLQLLDILTFQANATAGLKINTQRVVGRCENKPFTNNLKKRKFMLLKHNCYGTYLFLCVKLGGWSTPRSIVLCFFRKEIAADRAQFGSRLPQAGYGS